MASCVVCQAGIEEDARFCPSCGAEQPKVQASEGDDPFIGKTIARNFKIEKLLGVGGMGKVYKARQLSLDKDVVIKVLHDHFRDDPQLVQRFQREARAASRLNHPNSIQVIDFGQDDSGVLFMAIEFLNGTDLFSVLQKEGPFGADRVARIMIQVCSALAEAHEMNVIHRDLKPENIMVEDRRGRRDVVKVLDFGIAKIQDPDDNGGQALTQAGMVCGTPEYMSPEQARGQALDARSDLYSLGVLVYQLVCGELPFMADSPIGIVTKHILEKPEPPRAKYPQLNIPEALEAIILKAMDKEAAARFQSASEMQLAFEDMLRTSSGAVSGFEEPSQAAILSPAGSSMPTEDAQPAVAPPAEPAPAEQTPASSPAPTGGTQVQMSATGSSAAASGPKLTSPTPTGLVGAEADDDLSVKPNGGGAKMAALAGLGALVLAAGGAFAFKDAIFGAEPGGEDPTVAAGDGDDEAERPNDEDGPGEPGEGQGGEQKPSDGEPRGGQGGEQAAGQVAAQDDGEEGKPADKGAPSVRDPKAKEDKATKATGERDRPTRVAKADDDERGKPRARRRSVRRSDRQPDDDEGRAERPRAGEGNPSDEPKADDDEKPRPRDDKRPTPTRGDRGKAKKLVAQANKAFLGGNLDKAYDLAKDAMRADPSYAQPRLQIANIHRISGRKKQACAAGMDFIRLSPDMPKRKKHSYKKRFCD